MTSFLPCTTAFKATPSPKQDKNSIVRSDNVGQACRMAHFHPLRWEIDMSSYEATALEVDPIVQAVFLHEYVHYVQALTGTIGRHIVIELARLSVFAGISKKHGWPPPAGYAQVDLKHVLTEATRQDFEGGAPQREYREFCSELLFALTDRVVPAPANAALGSVVRLPLTVGSNSVDEFVHVIAQKNGEMVAVPVTDRVVFENMARQVQRNYLRFNNNLDVSPVDDERYKEHRDLTYVCLHDALKQRLAPSEDTAKWTIVLCQIALLCRNPGTAFEHMLNGLTGARTTDTTSFIQAMNRDAWFKGEFNEPSIQEVLNDLVSKWGTAMLPRENWELREFTKLVANACNALLGDYSLMAGSLISWKDVGHWIARFGCPPVVFADATCTQIQGINTVAPWTWYLRRLADLLSNPPAVPQ